MRALTYGVTLYNVFDRRRVYESIIPRPSNKQTRSLRWRAPGRVYYSEAEESEIPDQIHSAPCETGAESGKDEFVALAELVLVFVQTDRN